MSWSQKTRVAWFKAYHELQGSKGAHYFITESGYLRCQREAQEGKPIAEKTWALFMAIRLKG